MANLRPAARFLTRSLHTSPFATPTSTLRSATRQSFKLTTTTQRYKSDDTVSPSNRPVPVPGPDANNLRDTVSKTDTAGYPSSPGEPDEKLSSGISKPTVYSFEDIKSISENPSSSQMIIDVREPSELLGTGKIPGAKNVPVSSSDSFFMKPDEFEDKFGFERPGSDTEVIFYCKAGVRSNAAARLAGQAGFGGKIGEYPGSWSEWSSKGGKVEQEQ